MNKANFNISLFMYNLAVVLKINYVNSCIWAEVRQYTHLQRVIKTRWIEKKKNHEHSWHCNRHQWVANNHGDSGRTTPQIFTADQS